MSQLMKLLWLTCEQTEQHDCMQDFLGAKFLPWAVSVQQETLNQTGNELKGAERLRNE